MTGNLVDMPLYTYLSGEGACPACYKPVARNRKDGHCDDCLHDKELFPVNFKRYPVKKTDDDEDEYPYDY